MECRSWAFVARLTLGGVCVIAVFKPEWLLFYLSLNQHSGYSTGWEFLFLLSLSMIKLISTGLLKLVLSVSIIVCNIRISNQFNSQIGLFLFCCSYLRTTWWFSSNQSAACYWVKIGYWHIVPMLLLRMPVRHCNVEIDRVVVIVSAFLLVGEKSWSVHLRCQKWQKNCLQVSPTNIPT